MINKHYKIKFTDYQYNIFQNIDVNGNKRFYLMSIMSYLIKYSNEEFLVTKSLSRLFKMYQRYHKKVDSTVDSISRAYFFQLVNELTDLKLLVKDGRKIFIFDNKIYKKMDNHNSNSTIENTELKEHKLKPKYEDFNSNTNTSIYNNSNEIVAPVEVIASVVNVAKELGITRKKTIEKIQSLISKQIMTYSIQIQRFGMAAYLRKAVLEKYKQIAFYSSLAHSTRISAQTDANTFRSYTNGESNSQETFMKYGKDFYY